ncbi:MAG: hypothetical protein QXU18_11680 [Thermoplasmatales archaeon]
MVMVMLAFTAVGVHHSLNVGGNNPNFRMSNDNVIGQDLVSNNLNTTLAGYTDSFELHSVDSIERGISYKDDIFYVNYVRYEGNNPAIYAISLKDYVGNYPHSSLSELIKSNGNVVTSTIYPILGISLNYPYTFVDSPEYNIPWGF